MLHDLAAHGFPTVQYAVEMVADKLESRGTSPTWHLLQYRALRADHQGLYRTGVTS